MQIAELLSFGPPTRNIRTWLKASFLTCTRHPRIVNKQHKIQKTCMMTQVFVHYDNRRYVCASPNDHRKDRNTRNRTCAFCSKLAVGWSIADQRAIGGFQEEQNFKTILDFTQKRRSTIRKCAWRWYGSYNLCKVERWWKRQFSGRPYPTLPLSTTLTNALLLMPPYGRPLPFSHSPLICHFAVIPTRFTASWLALVVLAAVTAVMPSIWHTEKPPNGNRQSTRQKHRTVSFALDWKCPKGMQL